jgi:hypothetical protein
MPPRAPLPASASWLALLAATTLGSAVVGHVRARISGTVAESVGGYRLVVHSYEPGSVDAQGRPVHHVRPRGSIQRSVTAEELKRGVSVNLLQVDGVADASVVLAWVEGGQPTLEFDARTARPADDAWIGFGRAGSGVPAEVVLGRA